MIFNTKAILRRIVNFFTSLYNRVTYDLFIINIQRDFRRKTDT